MVIQKIFLFIIAIASNHLFAVESLILTQRQICDLELIFNGGFSPLTTFLNQEDYQSVLDNMRLADGTLWPIPVVLDISSELADKLALGQEILLKTQDYLTLASLIVSQIYKADKIKEALTVYGTTSHDHPGVNYLFNNTHQHYITGHLHKINDVPHYDFCQLRKTPAQLKEYFKLKNIDRVVAFQTRNPLHKAHVELTNRARQFADAHLLLHPAVGPTKSDDIDYMTRVRCYQRVLPYYPQDSVTLSLLPLAMRMAGPREAVWHAIIRKNFGCTHFIVGRDHAGPGKDSAGNDFYDPYQAQQLVLMHAQEIGIEVLPFTQMVYLPDQDVYKPVNEVTDNAKIATLSGSQLRDMLHAGQTIPAWFTYPEIEAELRKSYPAMHKKGFVILFTGLLASGKTTLANALSNRLQELQYRYVTILDGDIIRKELFAELGFSAQDRSKNIRRVAFIAQQIANSGGIALCSLVAPYHEDREYFKKLIGSNFLEIYISTPLEICQQRDPKGLYAAANEGKITNFTGISDRYDIPENPNLMINTACNTVQQSLELIVNYLRATHFI